MLDSVLQDVRYAFRSLRRTPAFAATAIVTLALGIGANTAIFSVLNGVLLRPLAYARSEQLIELSSRYRQFPGLASSLSVPEYQEFRRMSRSFADVGAFTTGEVNLTSGDRPLRVKSVRVDDHLLAVLGVHPASGRFFTPEEIAVANGVGGAPVAVLSYELWHSAFGGGVIVGEKVPIEGRPYEVIGVMPPGIDVMDNHTQVWLPLGLPPTVDRQRDSHLVHALARLKEGTTVDSARSELTALLADWGQRVGTRDHVPTREPSNEGEHTLHLEPLREAIVGDNARRAIWVLQIAVAFVLVIACANLAILMTARAEPRRREFAMRAARRQPPPPAPAGDHGGTAAWNRRRRAGSVGCRRQCAGPAARLSGESAADVRRRDRRAGVVVCAGRLDGDGYRLWTRAGASSDG